MKDMIALARGWLFRLKCRFLHPNITIDTGLRIYKRLIIHAVGKVSLGSNCRIEGIMGSPHKFVCIDVMNPEAEVNIGVNATLCAARITSRFSITIGDNVIIEDAGILDTDFHSLDRLRQIPQEETREKCKIRIGNDVGIGVQSFITKGVEIGDHVLVAPATVVSKNIKPGHFVYGNPAIVVDNKSH